MSPRLRSAISEYHKSQWLCDEIDEKGGTFIQCYVSDELAYTAQSVNGLEFKHEFLIHGGPCQDSLPIAGHQRKAKAPDRRKQRKGADRGERVVAYVETIHL